MLIHGLHIDTFVKSFWSIFLKVHGTIRLNQIWYMNCLHLSFVIGFCDLVLVASFILKRSFNEFNIFPTFPNVCYRFYIFPCFATSLEFFLFLNVNSVNLWIRAYVFGDSINKYHSQCINIISILILITLINLFL